MVSARGFEPPAPGFLPLRFSPPRYQACSWSGLSLHHGHKRDQGVARTVSTPSFRRTGELGSGLARSRRSERSPNLSESTMQFPDMAPNSYLRNPVLYPAELRGRTATSYLCLNISATLMHCFSVLSVLGGAAYREIRAGCFGSFNVFWIR